MKTYYKGCLAYEYLYKGFEYLAYDTGRKRGKWFVHFVTMPEKDQEIAEQKTKTAACNLAEKIIDKIL